MAPSEGSRGVPKGHALAHKSQQCPWKRRGSSKGCRPCLFKSYKTRVSLKGQSLQPRGRENKHAFS